MNMDRIIELQQEQLERYKALKNSCSTCIDDEVIESQMWTISILEECKKAGWFIPEAGEQMIGTLDLSGMAELKFGYDKYHLTVEDSETGDIYISLSTNSYTQFLQFLVNDPQIVDSEYYETFVRKNEFYLDILVLDY